MKKTFSLIALIFLCASLVYAAPPTPPATPLPSFSDGYLKSDSGTLSWATPAGAGDVVGPAASTQYKIPLWGASDKTLVDGVAVGTEGMLLRSAGAGANPAWSAYTLALPGDVGAVLYSDGTNWTRSASPAIPSMNLYGAASQLALGSNSSSTAPADASVVFRNATTDYYIILQSGATADENQTYTLPTALPTASGQVLSSTDAGVMSWIDAGSGSGDFKADGTVPMTAPIDMSTATVANSQGEIGFVTASHAFSFFANSEDLSLTASADTWTVNSSTGATAVTFSGTLTAPSFVSSAADGSRALLLTTNTAAAYSPGAGENSLYWEDNVAKVAMNGAEKSLMVKEDTYDRFNAVFDGGGSEIADAKKVYVYVPFDCTIVGAYAMADQSGSIVVDVWKDTMANYAPTDADTITASAPVTISTATNSSDTTLTGWTTTLSAGDVLAFNVDSCTTITWANITLKVVRR